MAYIIYTLKPIDGHQPKTCISKFAIVQETKKIFFYSAMLDYNIDLLKSQQIMCLIISMKI